MTPVGATTSPTAAPANGTATDAAKASLDYNAFLKLLLAQMQNQDPLKPMDSTEYVSQLATFSNVEQGLKINTKLDQLLILSNLAQASSAVGSSITSADGATTGTVKSVKVDDSGATAILTDGKQVKIESGVTFGAP